MNKPWPHFKVRWAQWIGVGPGLLALLVCVLMGPVAQAQTYAYRNDVFAYDTPSGGATSAVWHATGTSPACTDFPNGDDDWSDLTFPAGFTFTFGGVSYSSVRAYSNGMLAFPTDVSGFHRDYTPQALPITAASSFAYGGCVNAVPKNLMIAYWIDIIAGNANGIAGAAVKYELLGAAPNRRFVITWGNVALYGDTATRYSFQVALYESTAGVNGNFRYQYTTGSTTGVGATVGVQLTNTDYTQYAYNQNFIDTSVGTAILWYPANQLATKGAEYRFDESSWTGVAGEVKDTSGNNRNASRVGAAASVPPPPTLPGGKLCRGGSFTSNTSRNVIDAVATPIVPGNQGAIDFWFNSNIKWNTSNAMLFDATAVANRPFYLMKSNNGALTFVVTDSAGTMLTARAPAQTFALKTWHHIGVAWNVRVGTNQTALQIFLDGVLQNGAPTRGTTNGTMPALSSIYIGDNRTSGVTPSGGTGNGANGSIDEAYLYLIEISAPQAAADMNLTRPTCTTLDHFHIIHDGAVSTCSSVANITIEAHDSNHAQFSLAGTSMNLATDLGHGTWSNVAGGAINSLTALGAGTGTATYTFANESSVTFGLSNNLSEALNINVASGSITEHTGAAAACVAADYTTGSTCDASRTYSCAVLPANFNCVESGASAVTGHLYTKLVGTAFSFDVVALKSDGSQETSYAVGADKPVTVELVDGSGATACSARLAISPAVSQTLTFAAASQPTEQGRKSTTSMTVAKAYPDLRCRVTDANQSPSIVGCSSDDFAVRPTGFTVTSSANADATGVSSSATPIIKAGTNFTLTAASGAAGYNGTPKLDVSKIGAHSVALQPGSLSGSFGVADGLTGSVTGALFTYSEVGYFNFAANGVYDDTFSGVDSAADCSNDFSNTAVGGKYGCKFGNAATTTYFGRFIPDHFALTNPSMTQGCAAGSFTYMGQPFSLTASIVAHNLSGVKTQNYNGAFAKGVVSTQAENSNNGTALGSRVTFTAPWSGGAAAYAASQFSRPVTSPADATWGPFNALAFGATVTDGDGVLLIDRDMDQSTTSCTPDASGTSSGTCSAVTLAANSKFRFGRLYLQNAYGSDLLALAVPLEAQYWSGASFARNPLDSCSSVAVANVNLINYQGGITATNMGLSHVTAVAPFAAGLSNVSLSKPSPAPTAMGSLDLILNLGSAGLPVTCPTATPPSPLGSSTSAAMPYLSGNWCTAAAYDRDPFARATFGIYKSPLIYRRENY